MVSTPRHSGIEFDHGGASSVTSVRDSLNLPDGVSLEALDADPANFRDFAIAELSVLLDRLCAAHHSCQPQAKRVAEGPLAKSHRLSNNSAYHGRPTKTSGSTAEPPNKSPMHNCKRTAKRAASTDSCSSSKASFNSITSVRQNHQPPASFKPIKQNIQTPGLVPQLGLEETACSHRSLSGVSKEYVLTRSNVTDGRDACSITESCATVEDENEHCYSEQSKNDSPDSSSEDEDEYEIAPCWVKLEEGHSVRPSKSVEQFYRDGGDETEEDDQDRTISNSMRCLQRLVLQPTSWKRVIWDAICAACVLYDFVFVPLHFMGLPMESFAVAVEWSSTGFWTMDVIANLLTGYIDKIGRINTDVLEVMTHYAMTGLPLDGFVLICNWLELVLLSSPSELAEFKAALRWASWFRFARLLRMQRMTGHLENWRLNSDGLSVVINISKNVLGILLLVHFVACVWYGIGSDGGSSGEWANNWSALHRNEPPLGSRYAWSLHWSLLMLTGLGLQQMPQLDNAVEVIYVIFMLTFSFIVSAAFAGLITTSMTRFFVLRDQELVQFEILRKFCLDSGISSKLMARLLQNAEHVVTERRRNRPESSIQLLGVISEPLRMELHFELHSSRLQQLDFFRLFTGQYPRSMRRICHLAVSDIMFSLGDIAFYEGETPTRPRMYLILRGCMQYTKRDAPIEAPPQNVGELQPISEATLWTKWVHKGTVHALTACDVIGLDAKQFQDITALLREGEKPFLLEIYAREFVAFLNCSCPGDISDLVSSDTSKTLASRTFVCEKKVVKRSLVNTRRNSFPEIANTQRNSYREITKHDSARSDFSGIAPLPSGNHDKCQGETSSELSRSDSLNVRRSVSFTTNTAHEETSQLPHMRGRLSKRQETPRPSWVDPIH